MSGMMLYGQSSKIGEWLQKEIERNIKSRKLCRYDVTL